MTDASCARSKQIHLPAPASTLPRSAQLTPPRNLYSYPIPFIPHRFRPLRVITAIPSHLHHHIPTLNAPTTTHHSMAGAASAPPASHAPQDCAPQPESSTKHQTHPPTPSSTPKSPPKNSTPHPAPSNSPAHPPPTTVSPHPPPAILASTQPSLDTAAAHNLAPGASVNPSPLGSPAASSSSSSSSSSSADHRTPPRLSRSSPSHSPASSPSSVPASTSRPHPRPKKRPSANGIVRRSTDNFLSIRKLRSRIAAQLTGLPEATFEDGFLALDDINRVRRRPGRPSRHDLVERRRLGQLKAKLEREMQQMETRRSCRSTLRAVPSTEWRAGGEHGLAEAGKEDEEMRLDSGREDEEITPWVSRSERSRDGRRGARKQPRGGKRGSVEDNASNSSQERGALIEVPGAREGAKLAEKHGMTELRIDSGREDSGEDGGDGAMDESDDGALIEVPDTTGIENSVVTRRKAGRPKKDENRGAGLLDGTGSIYRKRKRTMSMAKITPGGKKRRGRPPGSVSKGLKRTNTAKMEEEKETMLDGEDGEEEVEKRVGRKKRSAKAPSVVGARRVTRSAGHTGADAEVMEDDGMPADLNGCYREIARLKHKLKLTEEMLRSEATRAVELEEALGLDIQIDAPSGADFERMKSRVAEMERELRARGKDLDEKDDIIREKNAAMRGFAEQVRELERNAETSGSGRRGGEQETGRVAELEALLREKETTIGRLRTMAERYEAGLKSVAVANRDLQKKVYSLNKVALGGIDE